ncbi:MAG: cation diffusion facilitator family transporter [Bacillota bacterium]|nr:cation diffusion facilitator family transporter [Bacillota bacterium]
MEGNQRAHHHGAQPCRCHATVKITVPGAPASEGIVGGKVCTCGKSRPAEAEEEEHPARAHDAAAHAHDHGQDACAHDHGHAQEHSHGHAHSHGGHGHGHHGHGHSHAGHAHSHALQSLDAVNRAFYIGIALNLIFTIVEFIIGYSTNSLALLADASHNLSDVASLLISLIGLKLAQKVSNSMYTYGYKKASILASLINAIILVFIAVNISIEAVERMRHAPELLGTPIIVTALIGVVINSLSAFLFFSGQKHDINVKGAFLHLLADAVVSLGVVVSGFIVFYTNLDIIDPILSMIIAIVVLASTWGLLKESIRLTLDGVPKNVDAERIKEILLHNDKIESFHDLHIWALGSSQNALTVHIIIKENLGIDELVEIKNAIKKQLSRENIWHATIEIDNSGACEYSC